MADETFDPTFGVVTDYTNMDPVPVIIYDNTSQSLIFENPIVTTSNTSTTSTNNLTFSSPAVFEKPITVRNNPTDIFVPMPLPSAPTMLNIPAIASVGTIQTTDLMVASGGSMQLYSDVSGTRFMEML